ncbi:hypothetical protein A2U01_0091209, partial [Trifolium medium]|nr:hypothetical protein [Trifolium medium]
MRTMVKYFSNSSPIPA